MSVDLRHKLLSDDGDWWETLANQTPERGARKSDHLIDWRGKHKDDLRRQRNAKEWSSAVCRKCSKRIPSDFPFCVYCGGGASDRRGFAEFILTVTDVDPRAEVPLSQFIGRCTSLGQGEISRVLANLPAVFIMHGEWEAVSATGSRIEEIGATLSVQRERSAKVGWMRELIESLFRNPSRGVLFLIFVALAASGWIWNWLVTIGAIVVAVAILVHEFSWYRNRYVLDEEATSAFISGLEMDQQIRSKTLLNGMSDSEMTDALTLFLMEFYHLHREFLFSERSFDQISGSRSDLRMLLEKNLVLHEYFLDLEKTCADIETGIERLDVDTLKRRLLTANGPEKKPLKRQIEAAERDTILLAGARKTMAQVRLRILDNVELMSNLRCRFDQVKAGEVETSLRSHFQKADEELNAEQVILSEVSEEVDAIAKALFQ